MVSELVSYLVSSIVRHSDAVQVTEDAKGGGIDVSVEVAADDFGRIIGRNGQTINAIRLLANLVGEREGKRVSVDVVDPTGRPRGGGHGRSD